MDLSTIQKIDKSKMYEIYDNWPKIARESFETNYEPIDFQNIEHIVFAGMGGSGAIGDIFASILSKSKIHVNVVKGYALPKTVDSNSLVVVISVSGDTNEAFSILESAHSIGSKIIVFSSGGKMKEYCQKNKINHRVIERFHSPRASYTSYLYGMLNVLHSALQIKREDITESIEELEKLGDNINSKNLSNSNQALNLAKWINGIPLIYYPFGLQSAAIRFKNSLQENTKMHTFNEDIIEVCHNGIVAWEHTSSVQPIIIQGADDHIKTKERCSLLEEYFKKNSIQFYKISSIKGSILSKLITLIFLLDYVTIYLAVLQNIDPTPVKSIDFIKKRLKEIS